jgi:ABC-type nitrate/sulfonate/bicarbonate transport system substrate-binding protein
MLTNNRIGVLRRTALALIALACIALSAPVGPATAQTDLPVIRLGTGPDPATTPVLYAISAGLYAKAGITVEPTLLGSGAAAAAAVSGGSIDIGKTSTVATIVMIAKGLPFTAIGSLGYYDSAKPNYALLVPADAPIKTPKDFEGKTFASLSLFDQNSIATSMWLDSHGVDRDTIKYAEIPPPAALAAMEQHRIDAVTVFEPFFSQMMATGKVRTMAYPYDSIAKRFPDTLMFANTAWVDAHKDIVDKFLRVTGEASAYVAAHEKESLPLLAAFLKLDPTTLGNQHFPGRAVLLTPPYLQPVIDAAAKYKAIPKDFPAQEMIYAGAPKK